MRLFQALAILLVISSCAHSRLKFVKVDQKQIVNVENKTIDKEVTNNYIEFSSKTTVTGLDSESNKLNKNEDVAPGHNASMANAQTYGSTTRDIDPKVSQEEVNEAIEAEEHARKAKILAISSVAAILAGSLILGLGFIASIVLAIIARIQYLKSSRSRFNTATGQYDEELARKWLLTYWIILGVATLLILALIVLFFW